MVLQRLRERISERLSGRFEERATEVVTELVDDLQGVAGRIIGFSVVAVVAAMTIRRLVEGPGRNA